MVVESSCRRGENMRKSVGSKLWTQEYSDQEYSDQRDELYLDLGTEKTQGNIDTPIGNKWTFCSSIHLAGWWQCPHSLENGPLTLKRKPTFSKTSSSNSLPILHTSLLPPRLLATASSALRGLQFLLLSPLRRSRAELHLRLHSSLICTPVCPLAFLLLHVLPLSSPSSHWSLPACIRMLGTLVCGDGLIVGLHPNVCGQCLRWSAKVFFYSNNRLRDFLVYLSFLDEWHSTVSCLMPLSVFSQFNDWIASLVVWLSCLRDKFIVSLYWMAWEVGLRELVRIENCYLTGVAMQKCY